MPKQAQEKKHKPTSQRARGSEAKRISHRHAPTAPSLQRVLIEPQRAAQDDVLILQRTVGNRATTRFIQAKLRVGPTGDRYEHEADRVADQVVRAPAPRPLTIRRKIEDEETLRTHSATTGAFTATSDLEQRLSQKKGSGSPLSDSTRAFMEPRFGANFGHVRVHTGRDAAQISHRIHAKAFTYGQEIYFGAGQFAPKSDGGKRLLAHELTHVVQQKGASVVKPTPVHRASSQRVQRIFGIGKTTRKSRVYKGRPGGRESQEKVVGVISMTAEQRAAELKRYLIDKPVKGNLNGFNVILPLLEGGSPHTVAGHFRRLGGEKSIDRYLAEIFRGYRRDYLLEVFNHGEPSAESKFALRAGLLTGTSFTFGRGSGRREHGVNKDLVVFARTLSANTLRTIMADKALMKPLTKKTRRLLQAELGAKEKEEQTEEAEKGSEKLVKQVELFDAYQKQLIEMVSKRPVKFFGSRTQHKQRLTNDLQQWAKGKPRQMMDKLLLPQSEFSQTLVRKYDKADVAYIKTLMRNPTSWTKRKGVQATDEEASLLQQIEALLTRQTSKNKFSRLRQRGQIQTQIEQLLFGEGGPANALATVRKLYGPAWRKTLGDKLQAAGLAESKTDELLTKIEHGAEAAGDIYQQLWRRVPRSPHAKWHRAKRRIRWSRTTLDLIQKLKPGTPEYKRVKKDHQLLSRIEAHSKTAHWQKITAILGMRRETSQERQPNTQKWQALLNAELTSKIINRATLYRHVFNAQQAAWEYGKSVAEEDERAGLGGLYESRDNLPQTIERGYDAFMNRLGEHVKISKWWNPGERRSRNRLKKALGIGDFTPYLHRLQVGDLLNAAKKTGGKRRTKQELIEFAIEGLSGQELLDQWVDLDRTNLVFKVKAELWGKREKDKNQKGFADLIKRPERVELERALLERVAKEALNAPRSKQDAADAMIAAGRMEAEQRDPDAAIRYIAQRTLAIAGLEGAQQLSKGKQWSRFSTRSLIYKEAQAEYLGKLRSTHTDLKTGTGEQKREKLSRGTQAIEETEKSLKSEEAAFKALRARYNRRLKAIVTAITSTVLGTLGLVFTGGLSAGPLMAGLWAALASVISKGISTLVDYTNEGNVVVTDTFRELFVDTVISFIGGIMGNVNLAVRSMGAEALYGKSASVGAKLFGKPGLGILSSWAQQMSTTVVGAPVHAIDRLLQSSSVTSAWQKSRENFAQTFKGLPVKTLQSYAKGFLTQAVVLGIVESGGGDLLPSVDHPALEKLGTGKGGMESKETFENYGAIRPFEFNSWESFWESIVKGSQVNTTDYGKSFIIYKEGMLNGWEVDTSVLTSDTGPQSLINAYKAMGFTVVMGSIQKGVGKTLSSLGPSKEPTLTERKGSGPQPGGYEALGDLDTGKLQQLNELGPEDRAKLTRLPVSHLQEMDVEKLIGLAEALTADQLAKLRGLSTEKVSTVRTLKLIELAKENTLTRRKFRKLDHLASWHFRLPNRSLIRLITTFKRRQLDAFASQKIGTYTLIRFLELPDETLETFARFASRKLAHLLKHFTKEDLVVLAEFDETRFNLLKALSRNRLTELSRLHRDELSELTANDLGGEGD